MLSTPKYGKKHQEQFAAGFIISHAIVFVNSFLQVFVIWQGDIKK